MWKDTLRLECKRPIHDVNDALEQPCCARHLLARQPDFEQQRTAIALAVEQNNHVFELYPKYHCECNFIERYWGAAKRAARQQCDYSYKGLCERLPIILDDVPLAFIRRFYRKAFRYIEGYAKGMDAGQAEQANKKYRSHRRLREDD